MTRIATVALAALAFAAAGCTLDPGAEVWEGREAHVVLGPRPGPVKVRWPVQVRRAAEFIIENQTGEPVETVIVDFSGPGHPRELMEAAITDPPGRNTYILSAPKPGWPLRARLGDPGTVLLAPGEKLTLQVSVSGTPGACSAVVTIPGREE